MIIGTFNGIPEKEPDTEIGFHDPDGLFPMPSFLEEPDTNRLARGELPDVRSQYNDCEGNSLPDSMTEEKGDEKDPYPVLYPMNLEDGTEHAILAHKRSNLECEKKTYLDVWHEPITQYNAQYPYNKVYEYHFDDELWGHVLEFDSTPGYERIHLFHSSGTFMEIMNDHQNDDCGRKVEKIVGDNFEIDMKNKHLYVKGDYKVTIDGNKDEYIEGNWYLHTKGSVVWKVEGEYIEEMSEFAPFEECKGGVAEKLPMVGGDGAAVDLDITGDWTELVDGDIITEANNVEVTAADSVTTVAGYSIKDKASYVEHEACEQLTLKGTTILQSTCLLMQNVKNMQMIIEPCSPCYSGSYTKYDTETGELISENNSFLGSAGISSGSLFKLPDLIDDPLDEV